MPKPIFPRVLIIGQTFSGISGASITLRNLFSNWPKDKIAVASLYINECDKEGFKYCINNYKLGAKEVTVLFPLNLFVKLGSSKLVCEPENCNKINDNLNKNRTLKNILKKFLIKTGLNSIRLKYNLSEDFIQWYNSFNPQIIYSAVGDIDIIRFLIKIKEINNVPIAIHIWDDWPNTLNERTIFRRYWGRKIDVEFRKLLDKADLFLCISNMMKDAYIKKYNRMFYTFHNPINLNEWKNVEKSGLKHETKQKSILYTGKINSNTIEQLILMANVIEKINDFNIEFKIYSPDKKKYEHKFKRYSKTRVSPAISHSLIIKEMIASDILFLPLGFDKKSIKYTKLSMPTKTSEYMISRVPIIVMAPREIALVDHAKRHKWALVVDKNDETQLRDALSTLLKNSEVRNEIINNAYNYAAINFASEVVQNNFRRLLSKYAKNR